MSSRDTIRKTIRQRENEITRSNEETHNEYKAEQKSQVDIFNFAKTALEQHLAGTLKRNQLVDRSEVDNAEQCVFMVDFKTIVDSALWDHTSGSEDDFPAEYIKFKYNVNQFTSKSTNEIDNHCLVSDKIYLFAQEEGKGLKRHFEIILKDSGQFLSARSKNKQQINVWTGPGSNNKYSSVLLKISSILKAMENTNAEDNHINLQPKAENSGQITDFLKDSIKDVSDTVEKSWILVSKRAMEAFDEVDQKFISKAYWQLLLLLWWGVTFFSDFVITLMLIFGSVKNAYLCEMHLNDINISHYNSSLCISKFSDNHTSKYLIAGAFPNPRYDSQYATLMWVQIGILLYSYIIVSFICIYIMNVQETLKDIQDECKRNTFKGWLFYSFVFTGFGPAYFVFRDFILQWVRHRDKFEKHSLCNLLLENILICHDAYLYSLQLVKTVFERLALFYCYLFMYFGHYETLVKGNEFMFYSMIALSLFFFTQDYYYWFAHITTQRKTTEQSKQVKLWVGGYLLIGLLTIGCFVYFSTLSYKYHGIGDGFKLHFWPILILLIFAVFMAIRFVACVCVAVEKTQKSAEQIVEYTKHHWTGNDHYHGFCYKITEYWNYTVCYLSYQISYLLGFMIYNIIPYAGGIERSYWNCWLFLVQYTVIYGIILFTMFNDCFATMDTSSMDQSIKTSSNETSTKNNNNYLHCDANGDFQGPLKWVLAILTLIIIYINYALYKLTIDWYNCTIRKEFLKNTVDYLDRNPEGQPGHYQDLPYFDRHDCSEKYLLITKNRKQVAEKIDHGDPLRPTAFNESLRKHIDEEVKLRIFRQTLRRGTYV